MRAEVSPTVFKEALISYSRRLEKAKEETNDLIVRVAELQRWLNSQPRRSVMLRLEP